MRDKQYEVLVTRDTRESALITVFAQNERAGGDQAINLAKSSGSRKVSWTRNEEIGSVYVGDMLHDVKEVPQATRFVHEWPGTVLVGQFMHYDLYYAKATPDVPEKIVARSGDEPDEYASGIRSSTVAPIKAGWMMADLMGVTKKASK